MIGKKKKESKNPIPINLKIEHSLLNGGLAMQSINQMIERKELTTFKIIKTGSELLKTLNEIWNT